MVGGEFWKELAWVGHPWRKRERSGLKKEGETSREAPSWKRMEGIELGEGVDRGGAST